MSEAFDAPAWLAPAELPADQISPQNLAILRWATAGYATASTDDPASTLYQPRIIGDVQLRQSAADAVAVGGRIALGIAEVKLWNADGAAGDLIRYGNADGRAARLRVVPVENARASDVGTPLAGRSVGLVLNAVTGEYLIERSEPVLAFAGIVRAVQPAGDRMASLALADLSESLATPLQPTRYAGAGGVEGGAELKGKPKPVCLGRVFNVEPVLLGNIDLGAGSLLTYQVNRREVVATDAVRIRGVAQNVVGGTPGVGQYRDWPALGLFQLGSTPDGAVRADVRGDAVGGYVNSIATVLRRLLTTLGPQLGDAEFDGVAWSFADFDLPGEVGLYQGAEETTAADAAAIVLEGCGAVLAGGRAGTLRLFDPLAKDTPQFDLPLGQILDCTPGPLPAALRPLPRSVAVDWQRNWSPTTEIAASVAAGLREQLGNESSGPARSESALITSRVAQQREMRLPGLYWNESEALARADKWRAWLEAGPRAFDVTTDRYLGQLELGHIGRITWPFHGLSAGVRGVVLAYAESLAGRRITFTLVTLPES